jgi:hypothetical protein
MKGVIGITMWSNREAEIFTDDNKIINYGIMIPIRAPKIGVYHNPVIKTEFPARGKFLTR